MSNVKSNFFDNRRRGAGAPPVFTTKGRCNKVEQIPAQCPTGWKSLGMSPVGSCMIGNTPGTGTTNLWRELGHQRICAKSFDEEESSKKMSIDCCSGKLGIGGSIECRNAGYIPYSNTCNNIMQQACSTVEFVDPYSTEKMKSGAIGVPTRIITPLAPELVSHCKTYLEKAPANTFFHNHSYRDYSRNFPKQNYTMPNFDGGWGYTPERTPYRPWHELQWKSANNHCINNPSKCNRGSRAPTAVG
jgi:hypothetical protein